MLSSPSPALPLTAEERSCLSNTVLASLTLSVLGSHCLPLPVLPAQHSHLSLPHLVSLAP